jgi:hypothetical protein
MKLRLPPLGEWLLDWERSKWDDEDIDDPTTAGMEIFDTEFMSEDAYIERDIISVERFYRLFISFGYAARRMPRLIAMEFDLLPLEHMFELLFVYETEDPPCMEWITPLGYLPDERVAEAWGFRLEDHEVKVWESREGLMSYKVNGDPLQDLRRRTT